MKRFFVFFVFFNFALYASAQKIEQGNIPAVVLNAFQLKFPNATDTSWEVKKGNYYVEFEVNNKSNKLILDHKGNLLKHMQDLYLSEVPNEVLKTIRTKAPFFDVHDADRTYMDGKVTYEIKFKNDGNNNIFWFDENSKLIKFRREMDNEEIPAEILNTITSRFASFELDRVKYLEEGNLKFYIIRGEINNYDCIWTIDNNSKVLKYEQDLRNSEIPSSVLNAQRISYPDYVIRDADKFEVKGEISYILRLRKLKENIYVTYNPAGKVLDVR